MNNLLTLSEAAILLGISKTGIQKVAAREKWVIVRKVGNVHLYNTADVCEYQDHRYRTKLTETFGWKGRGLYRVDDIDISCPICDCFAVEWPAPPQIPNRYLCPNGHKGYKPKEKTE